MRTNLDFFTIHPFTVDLQDKTCTLSGKEKALAVISGIAGLALFGIGAIFTFFGASYLLRKRNIEQMNKISKGSSEASNFQKTKPIANNTDEVVQKMLQPISKSSPKSLIPNSQKTEPKPKKTDKGLRETLEQSTSQPQTTQPTAENINDLSLQQQKGSHSQETGIFSDVLNFFSSRIFPSKKDFFGEVKKNISKNIINELGSIESLKSLLCSATFRSGDKEYTLPMTSIQPSQEALEFAINEAFKKAQENGIEDDPKTEIRWGAIAEDQRGQSHSIVGKYHLVLGQGTVAGTGVLDCSSDVDPENRDSLIKSVSRKIKITN